METAVCDGPRGCTKAELPGLIAVVDEAMRQGSGQTILTDYPLVYLDNNLDNLIVIKVNHEVAAVVPFVPRSIAVGASRFLIGIISPTATSPTHRKKGYGLRCLERCIARMTEAGCDLSVLWTKTETFPFYEKGGYQGVRSQGWIYPCIGRDAAIFRNNGEHIMEYDPSTRQYLPDIQRLHECEATGVQRAADEYPILFSLPRMKTYIAFRGQRPVAYLVFSQAINKPGMIEGGGDVAGLETLVNHLLTQGAMDQVIDAYDCLTPTVFGTLLAAKIPEAKQAVEAGPMMIRINHMHRFLQKISPWLERRNGPVDRDWSWKISDTGEVISFHFRQQRLNLDAEVMSDHMEMTLREWTSVIFGAHPARPVAVPKHLVNLFPLYFPIWKLDQS